MDPCKIPYHFELRMLRDFLRREIREFPIWQCETTSRIVRKLTGLEIVGREYLPVKKIPNGHVWNWDSERRLHIDLTMNQYDLYTGRNTPEIVILPEENDILKILPESIDRLKMEPANLREEKVAEHYLNKYLYPKPLPVLRAAFLN